MDTLSFTANEAGVDEDEYALVAGVACDKPFQYVNFQRDSEDSDDDWGIHFEFNDQINGDYECIRQCTLSRKRLRVELTRPIDPQKRISSVDVELKISKKQFKTFVEMLRRIFRNHESLLTIAEEPT
jgi:Immunity protein 10